MCRGHFLAACIGFLLIWHYGIDLTLATEPGYLDFDNLPETNFSCEGKVIGGYYADTETGCQMFHVCTIGQKGEITDIKFLCLNGTVFDQETRVCERLDEVDCSKSESFYDLNLELYGNNGAGYGIQPENEDIPNENLCEEEDEDECQTESPRVATKPQSEQVHASSSESDNEDTTTQAPVTPSTTSRRPVTSTSFPSTTPSPQVLQYPSSSPETIAALLALHNAFTQSLQQHSNNKDTKVNTPKLTGFVETLNPGKSTAEAETFEIKSVPSLPLSRPVSQFAPKPQNQFSIQQTPIKQFSSPPKPSQFQSPPKPQYQSPPKQQYKPQPKPQFQNPPKPQYQNPVKPPSPLPLPAVTYTKPVQTTSERFGNIPFHHSFHINSQANRYADQNYQDHYSDHEPQPSSQPQTEAPKQYDFDYEDDYYDEKPQTSTITPYLLHQLKVNQVRNTNQAKSSSVTHGSYVREVASQTQTKPFSVPSFRSVTTPGIAIITATSTTSSSSVKTSKPATSAIPSQKETLSTAGFINSILHETNGTHDLHEPPQSYDDYREGDVRSDPFYKDVPKIGRRKRSLENEISDVQNIDYGSLTKLKDLLENSLFKNNSKAILRAILNQFCSEKTNTYKNRLVSYCSPENQNSGSIELGENWKIVIPKGKSDFLYLVKTISTSDEKENTTSNILLLVNFPEEFKLLRDSVLKQMTTSELSLDKSKEVRIVNSSIHHRFKRVRRNRTEVSLDKNFSNKSKKENVPIKKIRENEQRVKRQTSQRGYSENIGIGQEENVQPQRTSQFSGERRTNRRRNQSAVRQTSAPVEESSVNDDTQEQRRIPVRQQRPFRRRRPPDPSQQTERLAPVEAVRQEPIRQPLRVQEERPHSIQQTSRDQISPTIETEQENYPRVPQELPSKQQTSDVRVLTSEDKNLGRPTSRRRNQGVRYQFKEYLHPEPTPSSSSEDETEVSTTYPFNLKPGTQFSCDDKIKGGYYADVEAECYGYFICSQGEINGPLLKSHFWCGPTTKFNQRSRTCQTEANVACSVSHRYFHLNKDILSLPDPEDDVKDSFEPSKV